MPLPRWIARLNARLTNRLVEPIARRALRSYAIVHHLGRTTGQSYRTPVLAFPHDRARVVALTYGTRADWVRNVLAGPAALEQQDGARLPIVDPAIVDRDAGWEAVGALYRPVLRLLRVHHLLRFGVGDLVEPHQGSPRL